ncbi:MAG: hypothetical protein GY925_07630 [Actinomycetia bacterium]|nr:hypothetical protein [Actinomycetes bacterium]
MNHNVRRFMSLWECPKPVIAEIAGWAIGGATDLVMCADLLFMADDAHIGYAPSRIYGLPATMMWIHRLGLEHAKQCLLTGRSIDAPTASASSARSTPPSNSPPPPKPKPAASPPFPPTSSPSTSSSSTRPTRTWACAPPRCSAPSSTASPVTPKKPSDGPKTSTIEAYATSSPTATDPGRTTDNSRSAVRPSVDRTPVRVGGANTPLNPHPTRSDWLDLAAA